MDPEKIPTEQEVAEQFGEDNLKRFGLSPMVVRDFWIAQQRMFENRTKLHAWCRSQENPRDPKFRLRMKLDSEFRGNAAMDLALLHHLYIDSGMNTADHILRAIIAAGAAALARIHRESLLQGRILAELSGTSPEVGAIIKHFSVIRGARFYKQLQDAAFDDLVADADRNTNREEF